MAIFAFVLGLLLATAGLGGLLASVDLLPTELGVLYAGCGTVALSSSFIVFAIAALIVRVDGLRRAMSAPRYEPPPAAVEAMAPTLEPEPVIEEPEAPPSPEEAPPIAPADQVVLAEEEPVNENRSGHLPTLAEVEHAIAQPEAPPTLVGRYTAGGAHYMIFSDGTIEAETEQGAFRFASMGDFKAYIAGRKA